MRWCPAKSLRSCWLGYPPLQECNSTTGTPKKARRSGRRRTPKKAAAVAGARLVEAETRQPRCACGTVVGARFRLKKRSHARTLVTSSAWRPKSSRDCGQSIPPRTTFARRAPSSRRRPSQALQIAGVNAETAKCHRPGGVELVLRRRNFISVGCTSRQFICILLANWQCSWVRKPVVSG